MNEKEREQFFRDVKIRSLDIDKTIQNLKDYIDLLEKEKQECKDEIRALKSEYYKDELVKGLQAEIRYVRSHSLIYVTDKELKDIEEFKNKHKESCNCRVFSYTQTHTSIGTCLSVTCEKCGDECSVTDFGEW